MMKFSRVVVFAGLFQAVAAFGGFAQVITTVVGTGIAGSAGDGGLAVGAQLRGPTSVALDSGNNLCIADRFEHRIRRVDGATGIITTIAGTGAAGFSGDGGPAAAARLNNPIGVAIDSNDNLFIIDLGNQRVRRVDAATGVLTTVAGTGFAGFGGDGGPAAGAQLNFPVGAAFDVNDHLYLADTGNLRIRRVDHVTGTITTVAGNGMFGFAGDGGLAINARLNAPQGVTLDSGGNLLIADTNNQRVRRVDGVTGIITTVAGTGLAGFGGDGGPAVNAQLRSPVGLTLDSNENLLIAERDNHLIRTVDHATGIINTLAGIGVLGFSGDGGPPTAARLWGPTGVVADAGDSFHIADTGNRRVRFVEVASPNAPPQALCRDLTVSANTDCAADVTPQQVDDGSFDPDGGPVDLDLSPPGPYGPGQTVVTLTVTDETGETASCEATITVIDDMAPVIDCPAEATLECPADTSPSNAGSATAIDNCDGAPLIEFSDAEPVPGPCQGAFGFTRTWTATDAGGNWASCEQTIIVVDTTVPTLEVDTTPITVVDTDCSGDESVTLPAASATDPCGDVTIINDGPPTFPAGATTTVTFTAIDDCGNAVEASVDVTVLHAANIEVRLVRRTIGPRSASGPRVQPLMGVEIRAYDKSEAGCARLQCGGISKNQYQCILDSCVPVNCAITDENGEATIDLPSGNYLIIAADESGTILPNPLGISAGELSCGGVKRRFLQHIQWQDR